MLELSKVELVDDDFKLVNVQVDDVIAQCLLNVISNAIKYNKSDGYVKIGCAPSHNMLEYRLLIVASAFSHQQKHKVF
ncbi:MAG: hypothetical protein IBX57_04370 [Gammaproteobacteria bacterium]|nr:hypothetical protein [Gammaproteobacteria bacterium]